MTPNEKRVYNALRGQSSSMELLPGGQVSQSSGINAQINQIVGNPAFKAEISLQVSRRNYTDAVAATPATPAAYVIVPGAAQDTNVPAYIFGNIDLAAHYARARQVVPGGAGWDYANEKWVRAGDNVATIRCLPQAAGAAEYPIGHVFFGLLQPGDLLMVTPMAGFVAAAVITSVRLEVLYRSPNVPYTSLLAALGSDLVTLNMIRYTVPLANVAQLAQQITLIKGSLFGKVSSDTLDPQTFITPGTFQPQIADIPITLPIDKNLILATQIVPFPAAVPSQFTWTMTVSSINKLTQ